MLLSSILSASCLGSSPDTTIVFHPHQYFVELDSLIPEDTLQAMLTDLNSIEVWADDDINLAVWQVIEFPFITNSGEEIFDINEVITTAKKKTKISSSALNIQHTVDLGVTANISSCFDLDILSDTVGSEGVVISILDTGISDISDNTTVELNYDLTTYTGYDYVRNDSIPDDEHGHGTHLAGLIHSITNHLNPGQTSITFDIRKTHDSQGQAFTSNVVFALLDAIKSKADIINMSFSVQDVYHDTLFFPLMHALEEAEREGVLVIAAAGNQSSDNDQDTATTLPASFPLPNIISVGSVSCENMPSSYTNYGGLSVDVSVLGEAIPGPDLANGISFVSGTSQAAAIVTSLSAILGSQQGNFEYAPIKCALIKNSKHFTALHDKNVSDGIIDTEFLYSDNLLNCNPNFDECLKAFTGNDALTGSPDLHFIIETNQAIESSQLLLSNSHSTYDAAFGVSLTPGFEMSSGGSFLIDLSGCND